MSDSCRCTDIETCEDEIETLKDAQEEITECGSYFQGIEENLRQLAVFCKEALAAGNKHKLSNGIKKSDNDLVSVKKRFANKISKKIESLESSLESMEAEDKRYHDAQEAAKKAAEEEEETEEGAEDAETTT